ncbi:Disease resistance protein RGA2 [Ananas comosus]|uniref:Disease resistance protein RGA2 n=1 Tax=Ananas comosus TaxID=4615 RepID=A0A199UL77_ANACO|nr:Disease resistance protein RGA2 [Ananas comosus]
MALALAGQSAASVVIEKLISTAVSYVGECGAGLSDVQKEIQRLRQAFPRIRAILTFVEEGQTVTTKQNEWLDAWLWQLRDAVDQAEDVLDEMEYYELEKAVKARDNKVRQGTELNLKRKFTEFANNIFGNDDTLTRLRGAMKALDHVAAGSEPLLQLVTQLYNSDVKRQQEDEIRNARETSSFLTEDTICGRDTEKERIVEWLTKPTSDEPENASATVGEVSAFAIVGMGGLGKTTLAQFIYHDEKVRQCFDLVLWVCVSDQFDVVVLTRKILEAAEVRDSLGDMCLNTIQEILKKKLISKKFLLVLDDVWADKKFLQWKSLVSPLKFGRQGSKILLTTRMDSVADTVANALRCKRESLKLSGLEKVDFMHLFNTHAFAGTNIDDHGNLKLIGEQIAKKLGGCPLAAKILGGCLNSCMDEKYWTRILNENFLNLQESEDNIMMILRLSYHHLPTSLQICFRYCSIFPKDHLFRKNELVRMWIGSGLIKRPIREKRSLEDMGEEYFNHLARKSLFDISRLGKGFYVMHDLLHDLAQLVSSGECLGIDDDGSRDIPETIRHLYVNRVPVNKVNPLMISHLKNLRTLIICLNESFTAVDFNKVLKDLKSLRFLEVTAADYKFPDEVGKLIHLRYLSLSISSGSNRENEITILPQSACRLYHLEIPWIGKLISLQELDNFRVREERGHKIDQLKNLQSLRKLGITSLENVTSPEEVADANLIEKKDLDELSLCWSTNRSGGLEVDEPLLDNLRPHTNLKELEIEGYAGVRSPCWMTEKSSLSNIRFITLSNCERWENLPPFGQLPLLKFLSLKGMQAVKKLCCPRSVGGCAFPSLQKLDLKRMPDLELFEGEHMFPLLNELEIGSCPSLKGLPALPLTLSRLRIWNSGLTSLPMMQQDCSSGQGRASCSSSSHPALFELSICACPNLTSLDGFMLQQQCFPALKSLYIVECENLRHLPEKFFQKLPSLEDLIIQMCPNLTTRGIPDDRLPNLDSLQIGGWASMTSLPTAEVFPRLSILSIRNCKELSSLDGLQALLPLQFLRIEGCDKLVELSLLQPPLGLTNISPTGTELFRLHIDRPALLRVEPLRNLNNSVSYLSITDGTELTSLDEQWLLQNRNSLRRLEIRKALSLESLPPSMIDLQSLTALEIYDARLLRSIPELPTSMKYLRISGCRPELKEYIEGSGKFVNICSASIHKQLKFDSKLNKQSSSLAQS